MKKPSLTKRINNLLIKTPLITLCFINIGANAQHLHTTYTNVVFTDGVNVREQASVKSKIIGKLSQEAKVEECDAVARIKDSIGGVVNYWRPIKYNNTVGYIWGQTLADGYFKSYEFSSDKFMLKHNTAKDELEVKVFRNGNLIHQTTLKTPKQKTVIGSTTFGKTYNSNGKEVLAIAFDYSESNKEELYMLFTWDGNKIEQTDIKLNDDSFITEKYHSFTDGIINANSVNIREEPSANSKVIQVCAKHTRVKIDSALLWIKNQKNRYEYWHKITVNNKTGYVFYNYLDVPVRYIKSNKNPKESFLYTNGAIYVFREDTIAYINRFQHVHYVRDNVLVNGRDNNHFVNFGHRGLNSDFQLLSVCHRAFSCGHWSGDELYVWDGIQLKALGSDGGTGDGSLSDGSSLIFPTDLGGIEGKIIQYEYASEMVDDINNSTCDPGYMNIYEYKTKRYLEYKNDSLVEVPSVDFYLRNYLKKLYPNHDLMQYEFKDLNNDSFLDAVFVLHTRDYEKKKNTKQFIGVAFGLDSTTFTDVKVNKSIVSSSDRVFLSINEHNKIEILILVNNEDYNYSIMVKNYVFTTETENKVIWQSKTEKYGREDNYNMTWEEGESQHFKTKKISFENAW